jgi:hypothetical protein
MMVYIGAEQALAQIPFTDEGSAISVRELSEEEQAVTKHFAKPYVYYVGAHEGCGCGFSYGQYPIHDEDDQEQYDTCRESVRQLAVYLSKAIEQVGSIELFACWDGHQEIVPEIRLLMSVSDIGGDEFGFEELSFVTIVA